MVLAAHIKIINYQEGVKIIIIHDKIEEDGVVEIWSKERKIVGEKKLGEVESKWGKSLDMVSDIRLSASVLENQYQKSHVTNTFFLSLRLSTNTVFWKRRRFCPELTQFLFHITNFALPFGIRHQFCPFPLFFLFFSFNSKK